MGNYTCNIKVGEADIGNYTCVAENLVNRRFSAPANIRIFGNFSFDYENVSLLGPHGFFTILV